MRKISTSMGFVEFIRTSVDLSELRKEEHEKNMATKYRDIAVSCLAYYTSGKLIQLVSSAPALTEQCELGSYCIAQVNSLVCTSTCFGYLYSLYKDMKAGRVHVIGLDDLLFDKMVNSFVGYLLADLFLTYPIWKQSPDFLLHHILGLLLLFGGAGQAHAKFANVRPMAACLIGVEVSSIFLNLRWFLTKGNARQSLRTAVEAAFAASFLLSRCVWLPFIQIRLKDTISAMAGRKTLLILLVVQLLQFEWGRRIVKMVARKA